LGDESPILDDGHQVEANLGGGVAGGREGGREGGVIMVLMGKICTLDATM